MAIAPSELYQGYLPPHIWDNLNYPPNLPIEHIPPPEDPHAFKHAIHYATGLLGVPQYENDQDRQEQPLAMMSEYLTLIALQRPFREYGIETALAPVYLEEGGESARGVDLILHDSLQVLLGVNVKLRDRTAADGFGFDRRTRSPRINCSIGSWRTMIREHKHQVSFRDWAREAAYGRMIGNRSLPQFHKFRSYLLNRLGHSLATYHDRALKAYVYGTTRQSGRHPLLPDTSIEPYIDHIQLLTDMCFELERAFS